MSDIDIDYDEGWEDGWEAGYRRGYENALVDAENNVAHILNILLPRCHGVAIWLRGKVKAVFQQLWRRQ